MRRYRGEVIYLYAFDVAYEMERAPISHLLGEPVAEFAIGSSRRTPHQAIVYRPQMVTLSPVERHGPLGAMQIQRAVKILAVGAISIAYRVAFEVDELAELVAYHDLRFDKGSLQEEVSALAEAVRLELLPHLIRPRKQLAEEEAYTVFCLEAWSEGPTAEEWLAENRREVAALLTQEPEPAALSRQEAEESSSAHLSYYRNDLAIADWDAALLLDEPANFAETVYVLEIANLQLSELQAYDRRLDDSLDRSYRDLASRSLSSRAGVLRELRSLRIDIARFSDELSNITKFFGDWHLARIYQALASRFHLADWQRSIDRKMQTLDDLYAILAHDRMNRVMVLLEVTIVLLFIVDLVLLYAGVK